MNFAYMAGFQAIYFMDPQFRKAIDIFVREMNLQGIILSKTFFTKCIVGILYIYDVHEDCDHTIGNLSHSHPQFPCSMLGTPWTKTPF